MRKILENLAILSVVLLSVAIIYLIIRYNMIEEETSTEIIVKDEPITKEVTKKEKVSNYLQNLEGYKDIDVKVDARAEDDNTNKVKIISESNVNELKIKKVVENTSDTQIIPEDGKNKVDKVGKALDNLLGDL